MKKIKIIKKKLRLFLPYLGLCFLIFIATFFILIPKFRSLAEINSQIVQNREKLNKLLTKLADLEGVDAANLKERADFALEIVPAFKNPTKIFGIISTIAGESQVYLSSLQLSPGELSTVSAEKTSKSDIETIPIQVLVEGTKERIFNFVDLLEKSIPLMSVKTFKISEYGQSARGEIVVISYFSPLPKTLGKIDTPVSKISEEEEKVLSQLENFKRIELFSLEENIDSSPASLRRIDPFSF